MCNCPVKGLSRLFREVLPNHRKDFYCLNCFNSYSSENKLKEHEEICNKYDISRFIMPRWNGKALKYNHGEKSLKAPIVIYLDLECLLLKILSYQNNYKNFLH